MYILTLMGTVLEFFGVKVRVLAGDHQPPHCHCYRGDSEARFDLRRKEWLSSKGFSRNDLNTIEVLILTYHADLMHEWERLNER